MPFSAFLRRLVLPAALFASASLSPAVQAQCGARYAAPNGDSSPANTCLNIATPCRSVNHAISVACANDAIQLLEGTYTEDIVADRALFINSYGNNALTILRGSGSSDVVRITASGVTLNGFAVEGPSGNACVRIGDAAHPGVRTVQLSNNNINGCAQGVVIDSINATGDWVSIAGNVIRNSVAGAAPNSGVGILITGGGGKIKATQNQLTGHGGPAVRVAASAQNGQTIFAGCTFANNGLASAATSRAAVEVHGGIDFRLEGNEFYGQKGLPAVDDGRAAVIDGTTSANVFCNNVHDNDGGIEFTGAVSGVLVHSNAFDRQSGTAVRLAAGTAAGVIINESIFRGNGAGVVNLDTQAVNAEHSWWGTADGPSGAGGTGDSVSGPASVARFIPRIDRPILARNPTNGGWAWPSAACFDTLQPALDAAPLGGLVLIGDGELRGRATLTRPVNIEGRPGDVQFEWCDHCHPSVIDGTQLTEPRRPGLEISNVSGIYIRNITFHGAGMGTPACFGGHQDTEIGLHLVNVKNSTFEELSFRENGTTELRIDGDSDDNTFRTMYLDGMIRDGDNEDRCGHRSREGILIDGGARVCEGGSGAYAERNHIFATSTYHNTRSVKLRYANGTEIANSILHGVPSDEWPDPTTVNVWIEASSNTNLHDNPEIANRGVTDAIQIRGSSNGCEVIDSAGTLITGNTINMIDNGGHGLHLVAPVAGGGAPKRTQVNCSSFLNCWFGVDAEYVGTGADATTITLTDFAGNTNGVRNQSADLLAVRQSWWGAPSGPSGDFPGTGNSATGPVDPSGWLSSSSHDDADHDGFTECQGDANDGDASIMPYDPCDGFDNDQDGTIDEDFVSTATTCGLGECASSGMSSCVAGVVQNNCTPKPPLSTTDATCDNVDDNCNGRIDEDYPSQPVTCGSGGCARTGTIGCVNGTVQNTCVPGSPAPNDAVCNGIDDNCNGPIDEDYTSRATTCGTGVCASTGTTSCVAGSEHDSCVAGPKNSTDDASCNGLDDNCNGLVDEDYVTRATSCGIGVCANTGFSSCTAGVEHDSCVPYPPPVQLDGSCNGQDDNCNGLVDEDFVPFLSTCGTGACAQLGNVTCVAGQLQDNCAPLAPVAEICNGIDDDCDGTVDNVGAPAFRPELTVTKSASGRAVLGWTTPWIPGSPGLAPAFDVLEGNVMALMIAQQIGLSIDHCVIENYGDTTFTDKSPDPAPGDSRWYLVRIQNCGGNGTYDDGPGLQFPRDASIEASPFACP